VNNKTQTYFNSILRNYRKKRALNRIAHLGLDILLFNAVYVIFCLIMESIWYLSPQLKSVLWLLLFLNFFFLYRGSAILLDLILVKDRHKNESLLLEIGRKFPEIQDKLLNYYQLTFLDNEIAQYGVKGFIEKYPSEYFKNTYQSMPVKTKLWLVFSSVIVFSVLSFITNGALSRFLHMKTTYEPASEYYIITDPPTIDLYSNDSLTIKIRKLAPGNFPVEISSNNEGDPYRTFDSLITFSPGGLTRSAIYYVRLCRPNIFYPRRYIETDTVLVNVLQRPRIMKMNIFVTPPAYSKIPVANYQGNMDRIRMLTGSLVHVQLVLSVNAGQSFAVYGQDTLEMKINGNMADVDLKPLQDGLLKLTLYNDEGIKTESDPEYYIDLDADLYPDLTVLKPDMSEEHILGNDMALPYVAILQDDFGLSSFTVNYKSFSEYSFSNDTNFTTIELPFSSESSLQTRIGVWTINDFISPGSEIRYYFELFDNDSVSGPKGVRSGMYYATLPTLGDLYDSQNDAQKETMAMLEDERASTKEIVEDLNDIQKELLKEGAMDWEDKTALEENLRSLENVKNELQEMQTALEEQKQFMEEHKLFSDKIMQSFEQLQELMNELIDDDMFNMMQELQKKLDQNDTSDMEELLKDFNEKVQRFEESLDRMLEVFKRIQQEQRLEELGQKIKESLKEQQKLLDESEQRTLDDLAEEQGKITSDVEEWEALGQESAELFEKDDKELYEDFLKSMEDIDATSSMNEAMSQYQQGNRQKGQQKSHESESKLSSLEKAFSNMSSSMMQQQKAEISQAFQTAFRMALFLSNEQESILEKGRDLKDGSPLIHTYTSKMNDNLNLAYDINDVLLMLSKKTFMVDKALGLAMGQVIGNLRSGIQNVEEAKLSQGQKNFEQAFKNMNLLAKILRDRSDMVNEQQGNASGLEFYMQQLQQMAGQQQQLNSGMPKPGMDGSPGSSMMDQLAKIAARQQALRRKLKQIQQGISESGDGNQMTGNLDRIAKDMEDVINQMRKNRVDRETILRQEKIVQRLLDASRSATTRDYKKERESKTGTEILRDNPLSLPVDLGDRESLINMIRRDVRNSDLSPKEKLEMERYLESLIGSGSAPENK
jgi:hypothetical protein